MGKANTAAAPHLDEYLTEKEAAVVLKLNRNTLAKWRLRGVGPVYFQVGRHIRYGKNELAAWMAANARQSTSQVI